ncbi:MAG: DUF58 domain-containing protein [Candidatus Aenigmarchaeota archaeon ex4484_52]|nr:MAG: DUF58 domain-containing protein [Candidatus Aenigmarchaeota archaeon ex4484_52]
MPKVKEILRRVKNIEVKTNKLVEGLIAGNYHSIFKGRGIEFSEVREYIPGDDIRTIDWNVTARFNYPYIKEFIEERDLNMYIVFDISASNNFGSFEKSKKESGFEIAASLMFAALKNNDNVGLCLFTDHIERFIRPRKGKKFILKLLRELIYYKAKSSKTDIKKALTCLSRIIKKRSIIFIISDFISEDFEKPVNFLKNKNDVIFINISDIREKDIPNIGYVFLEDDETGEQILVNTAEEDFRKIYTQKIKEKNNAFQTRMKKIKIDLIQLKTTESFEVPLKKFFYLKRKRG